MFALLLTWALVFPRHPLRRLRPADVRRRAEHTRTCLEAGAQEPAGARFLGDTPPTTGPPPADQGAAIRLTARYSRFPAAFSVTHQEPYRDLPRIRDRLLRVSLDGTPVPADWSTWWYPVTPGRHTLTVEHPVPATLEVDVEAGQVVQVFHWAHLMEDRLEAFAIVPALSAAVLTTRRFRRGTVDEPVLPGRTGGGLLTDEQLRVLRQRSRRPRNDPGHDRP